MRLFSVRPTFTMKGRKFKGIRGWSGKPTHPPLTDVPIGAYILAAAFDVLSFLFGEGETGRYLFVAATYALIAGAIASVPTALTGLVDWKKSTPKGTQAWRTANAHMAFMLTNTAIVIVAIVLRLGDFDNRPSTSVAFLILSLLIAGILTIGASLGGTLVYEYEFNVEQDKGFAWAESERDYLPYEKPEDDKPHA